MTVGAVTVKQVVGRVLVSAAAATAADLLRRCMSGLP